MAEKMQPMEEVSWMMFCYNPDHLRKIYHRHRVVSGIKNVKSQSRFLHHHYFHFRDDGRERGYGQMQSAPCRGGDAQ